MTAQIVEIAGQKIVMLPIEDYQRLTDIAEDKADALAAMESERRRNAGEENAGEEYVPAEVAARIMAGESPLRAWRKHRKLKIRDLAAGIGCSQAFLSMVERGERDLSSSNWRRLAAHLNLAIDDIMSLE